MTTVRHEDDNIVVVGGTDEEGIDLTVPLEDLDKIGSWVMDRGMKILLDISTYADYSEEKSRTHLAAATAIRSLNDRAHERYRAGDRRKALLVIDEAHYLAPKDNAPEPDLDDWVKRCRGQIIKASTEGGNKGISTIVAYQRRAFLHNGVIQLCKDWIVHGLEADDADTASKKLRIDRDLIDELGTGEILAKGENITGGDLVGPTKVRKRHSPDPREDTFEIPDTPPEVSDLLDEIQDEIEADAEEREKRQTRIEELEEKLEQRDERIDELEEDLQNSERIARALENLQSGGNGDPSEELVDRVEELETRKQELQEELDRVKQEKTALSEELDQKKAAFEDLQERYENDLAGLNSLRSGLQQLGFGADADASVDHVDEDRIQRVVEEKVEQMDVDGSSESFDDVQDVLLSEFQEEAVDRILSRADGLSERQRKLLRYIEARGKNIDSMKKWATEALGLESRPGSGVYNDMKALVEDGFVKKNKDGSVSPRVRSMVEDELSGYDVDTEDIEETYQRVLSKIGSIDNDGQGGS